MPGEELHEAQRQQPRALRGFIDAVQRVGGGEPLDLHALRLQPLPRILIRGKFLAKRDDLVARAPIQTHRDGRQAFRSVLQQRDLAQASALISRAVARRSASYVSSHSS